MIINKYSKKELKEFREIILDKISKAKEELNMLEASLTENKTSSSESGVIKVDDSAEVAERETLSELATRQARFMNNLEAALQRIENGTYGVCRMTGKLINKERLRLVPHATLSVEAKNSRG
ncbi:MAG: TraR/DksA C4-type zinc finger protein [Bacteroidota bacterium]